MHCGKSSGRPVRAVQRELLRCFWPFFCPCLQSSEGTLMDLLHTSDGTSAKVLPRRMRRGAHPRPRRSRRCWFPGGPRFSAENRQGGLARSENPKQEKKKEENKAQRCCFLAPPELQSGGSRKHADICELRLIDAAASLFSSQLDPQLSGEELGAHRGSCAGGRQRRPYLSGSPPRLWRATTRLLSWCLQVWLLAC